MIAALWSILAFCAEPERSLINKSCVCCHDADEPKGGLNLAAIAADNADGFRHLALDADG